MGSGHRRLNTVCWEGDVVLPLGHAAVGYLVSALPAFVRDYEPPRGAELLALLVGTQAPDLVDKPLAYFGVIASGRSLAHSLLVAGPLVALGYWLRPRRVPARVAGFFVVGYLAHLPADTYRLLLAGRWSEARFLLWPAFPPLDYPGDDVAPWARLADAYRSLSVRSEFGLVALAGIVGLLHRYRD